MNELDLFRDFRRGVASPSGDANGRASARLAGAVAGARVASSDRRRLRGSFAHAGGRRRRLVLLAAAALVALVGTASAFSTVRDFILDREAQSVDYCIGSALRAKVISFRSSDGMPLHGLLLGSGHKGIVLASGNGFRENLCEWLPLARPLAQRDYRVLAFDSRPLPPRPRVGAAPPTVHFERDVLTAERELLRRGVRRVLVGGGGLIGTAAMTAAARIPRSLLAGVVVLSSPETFGGMSAAAAARRVTAPSFFAAGSHGGGLVEIRKLYAASASKRKKLVVVRSSGTGTQLLDRSWAPASFQRKLLAFIAASFKS